MAVLKKCLSQVCHKILAIFIWLICFDPSNFKITCLSKAVTRQGNGLLAYDCHQLTLFPVKISFYLKNFLNAAFCGQRDRGRLANTVPKQLRKRRKCLSWAHQ